jgi:hypothetical protein
VTDLVDRLGDGAGDTTIAQVGAVGAGGDEWSDALNDAIVDAEIRPRDK